jgi:acyl carrier protein
MGHYPALDRAAVLRMLAELNNSDADPARERLASMEVAWLVHQVEQRYDVLIDLDDDQLARLRTISDAVEVLGKSVQAGRA